MTAPAPTEAREAARARFLSAALWWMADQSCSSAFAEMEDAYDELMALARPALATVLALAGDARRAETTGSAREHATPQGERPTPILHPQDREDRS